MAHDWWLSSFFQRVMGARHWSVDEMTPNVATTVLRYAAVHEQMSRAARPHEARVEGQVSNLMK